MVEPIIDVGWEKGRDAPEALEKNLRDLVLFAGVHRHLEGAYVKDLHIIWEAALKLEWERVLVPGEGPSSVFRAAENAEGKLVGDDDDAVL